MLPAILKSIILKAAQIRIENGESPEKALSTFEKISDEDRNEIIDIIKNKRGDLYGV